MALADVFEKVAGPDAPVEFVAYDGSRAGAPDAPVRITVRSPVAVSLPWPRRRARWAWPALFFFFFFFFFVRRRGRLAGLYEKCVRGQ